MSIPIGYLADAPKRQFITLAKEIIARIEEAGGPEWWPDLDTLTDRLEAARREFLPPQSPFDWPAFLVCDVSRGSRGHGFTRGFHRLLQSPFSGSRPPKRYGVVLTYDPVTGVKSNPSIWVQYDRAVRPLCYTAQDATNALRRWVRAVQTGMVKPLKPTTRGPMDEAFAAIQQGMRSFNEQAAEISSALLFSRPSGNKPEPINLTDNAVAMADNPKQDNTPGNAANAEHPSAAKPANVAERDGYPTPDNYKRDKWIYERRNASVSISDIIDELEAKSPIKKWEPLESANGIREAVKRYCKHNGLEVPKGKPGRPSTQRK